MRTRSAKSKAFQATREVCGVEVCPIAKRITEEGLTGPELKKALATMTTTSHQLRHALASLLVMHNDPDLVKCPNCEVRLPEHNDLCHVGKLLKGTA